MNSLRGVLHGVLWIRSYGLAKFRHAQLQEVGLTKIPRDHEIFEYLSLAGHIRGLVAIHAPFLHLFIPHFEHTLKVRRA